jgi:D-xylose 1-dehydrogenase
LGGSHSRHLSRSRRQSRPGHRWRIRHREAIARGFARRKSTVVFFDIADKAGMSLTRELSGQGLATHFAHVDVTDIPALRAGIAEACKVYGPIAILINNAA